MIFREADDRDLVLRGREGRVDAFNALVTRWEKRIYNYLLRLSPDPDEAFDLAQETIDQPGRLDDPGAFWRRSRLIASLCAMRYSHGPKRAGSSSRPRF